MLVQPDRMPLSQIAQLSITLVYERWLERDDAKSGANSAVSFLSRIDSSRTATEQASLIPLQSHQPTATLPLRSEALTPETCVTLPELEELSRVTAVTSPETLVVTPVEAVARLPLPDRDWNEREGAITNQISWCNRLDSS